MGWFKKFTCTRCKRDHYIHVKDLKEGHPFCPYCGKTWNWNPERCRECDSKDFEETPNVIHPDKPPFRTCRSCRLVQ